MPINRLIERSELTPEEIERLRMAFDAAVRRLIGWSQRSDLRDRGPQVIKIGADGTRNAQEIAALAAKELAP